MASFATALLDLRELDRMALQETPLHRLDPRVKTLATVVYLVVLASFGRQDVAGLLPLALFPVVLAVLGIVPVGLLVRKVALSLPFIVLLGAFLPVLERTPVLDLGPLQLSAGWIAFASLLLRAVLAVASATVLVAVTGMADLGSALDRLGLPRAFVQQLLLLYRYIFLLGEETRRRLLARTLRAHGRGLGWAEFPAFAGHLLLRSWERAERVHAALLARGFQGTLPPRELTQLGLRAWTFLLGWTCYFLCCRFLPVTNLLGSLAGGGP
jgi:cobalt/nickel transport system permease protein